MRSNNAGCLSALLPAFSRIMLLMYWIARPVQMQVTFNTFILPCLGFLFLPFTTLMYEWLFFSSQGIGVQGLDWLWLGLAVLLDMASIAGAAAINSNRLPGSSAGSTQTPTNPGPSN
jgi:hypothetical protein